MNTFKLKHSGLIAQIWRHLSQKRKVQFTLLTLLMLISAFSEVLSLGAVLPFIGALTSPEKILDNPALAYLAKNYGITRADELLLPITLIFVFAALMAGIIRISLLWASTKLTIGSGADLSMEVYRRTLYQPYTVHIARNSSETISTIISKVDISIYGVMWPFLSLISSSVLLLAISIALLAINPAIATIAMVGFGSSYGLITFTARRRLKINSARIADEHKHVVKALQEGLGGIRDVLLDGTQEVYCKIYQQADYPLRKAHGNNIFVGGSPRFAMEAIGMVLIAGLAYALSINSDGFSSTLPTLGALALGAQRLLPALQQVYSSWASIIGSKSSLAEVVKLLEQPLPLSHCNSSPDEVEFDHSIELENVCFSYGADGPMVLDGLNLKIPKGSRVGLIGSTGSGKSTILDIIMGLLKPEVGKLLVDSRCVEGNLIRSWQKQIAHVPQSIFLSDATIAENIAFCVPKPLINMHRVELAAKKAQLDEFIKQCPGGYESLVGERGVRLSGGQRQRIGIARALYKESSVLILDEATSALDNATEQSVMQAVEALNRDLTIIIIAHRVSTLKYCDFIIELEGGKIVSQGSYFDLIAPKGY